jgi:hypothetical protein
MMASTGSGHESSAARGYVRNLQDRWFAGLSWKGMALIALVCILNAVRRSSGSIDEPLPDWMLLTARFAASGLVIAVPVALAVVATYNLAPRRPSLRYTALALAVAVSSLAGVIVAAAVSAPEECGSSFVTCIRHPPTQYVLQTWVRYGLLCTMFSVVFVYSQVADESIFRARDAERERARFVQRMGEARLKMLQAQIEPHFLFNSLATVRRLYQTAPLDAETMLDNLMRYFEIALPHMRAAHSTLGREADLTGAYLAIQRMRMGRRLTFTVDIPESLRDALLPPMMLLTLAENSIKHGLAPLPEGGFVHISAFASNDVLKVIVADSGQGFTRSSGGGTGLANIRARLAAMYGGAGQLTLSASPARGITAAIVVPLGSPAPAAAPS